MNADAQAHPRDTPQAWHARAVCSCTPFVCSCIFSAIFQVHALSRSRRHGRRPLDHSGAGAVMSRPWGGLRGPRNTKISVTDSYHDLVAPLWAVTEVISRAAREGAHYFDSVGESGVACWCACVPWVTQWWVRRRRGFGWRRARVRAEGVTGAWRPSLVGGAGFMAGWGSPRAVVVPWALLAGLGASASGYRCWGGGDSRRDAWR